ncbi:MAG: hypothetical protein KZQ58_13450 [gamma proteobacterium symbiont of Bathyaustriella thionipta]|nr:hypothetical protein [gamma proteobacterium symbiont of Bathyaustriella thionipta]
MLKNIHFEMNGGKLKAFPEKPLTDDQREYIRAHKWWIMTRVRLAALSEPEAMNEMLSWYRESQRRIAPARNKTLAALLADYRRNRAKYQRAQSDRK